MDATSLIDTRAGVRNGKPCFIGTRISVDDVLEYLASGMSDEEIISDLPELTEQHLRAALEFGAIEDTATSETTELGYPEERAPRGLPMKTMSVDDRLYGAIEALADRDGRPVHELVNEALVSWLADAEMDDTDHDEIKQARIEAAETGCIEFEEFFKELLGDRT